MKRSVADIITEWKANTPEGRAVAERERQRAEAKPPSLVQGLVAVAAIIGALTVAREVGLLLGLLR